MRFLAIVALLGLISGQATAQQDTDKRKATRTYVLIDGSGSMADGVNWSDAQNIVSTRLAALKQQSPASDISITQLRSDENRCETQFELGPFQRTDAASWSSQEPTGSTLIGAGFQKVLELSDQTPTHVVIITDGSQTCGPTICEVARSLLPSRPNITVEFAFTEDAAVDSNDLRQCVEAARSTNVGAGQAKPLPPHVEPKPYIPTLAEKWFWLLPLAALTASAVLFAFHYGHKTKIVQNEIKNAVKARTSAEASASKDPPVSDKIAKERQAEDSPKKQTLTRAWQHLRARMTGWSWAGSIFAALGVFSLGLLVFIEVEFLENARQASWRVLNTEFGAIAFASSEISIAGFAAIQFWRYGQAKKDLAIESGALELAREERNLRNQVRMHETYLRLRRELQNISFSLPRSYAWPIRLTSTQLEKFRALLSTLTTFAAGEEKELRDVKESELTRLRRYIGVRDLDRFRTLLQADKITPTNIDTLYDVLGAASLGHWGKVGELLDAHATRSA